MDYDKLIDAVKLCGSAPKVYQCKQCAYWAGGDMSKCIPKMTADAALAIETLRAETERMRHYEERCHDCTVVCAKNEIIKAWEELDRIKAERDTAIKDLNTLRKQSGWECFACYYSDHYNRSICAGCDYNDGNNWEWRGPKKED